MCWGYFKKLVIADNVGVIANKVFALADPSFEMLWAGVFAFAIQIYADFSAYTDIARGASRWLGIELTENFDHPYLARTPSDFWRRWNISLSTWFRDYVYIPLGGSRATGWLWVRNVLVTFLLSGLWHGASWNYVLWGLYHGLLLVITRAHQILRPASACAAAVDGGGPDRRNVRAHAVWMAAVSRDRPCRHRSRHPSGALAQHAAGSSGGAVSLSADVLYSIPLWVQSVWVELHRGTPAPAPESVSIWQSPVMKALACGAAFTAILVLRSRTSLDFIYFQF